MKKIMSAFDERDVRERLRKTRLHLNAHINLAAALMEPKPWLDLTADEATEIWERIDERDGWELIMQVQKALKEKNT